VQLSLISASALALSLSFCGLGCPYSGGGSGGGGYYGDDDDFGCGDSFDCDDLEFCNAGECDEGLDRRYRVTMLEAEAETSGPSGSWDVGGGAPDLYVQWGIRDGANEEWLDDCFTSTRQDSFDPSWGEYCDFVLGSGETFAIWVWDEDIADPDFAGGVYWQGNDALIAVIRADGLTSSNEVGDSVLVRWTIEPTF